MTSIIDELLGIAGKLEGLITRSKEPAVREPYRTWAKRPVRLQGLGVVHGPATTLTCTIETSNHHHPECTSARNGAEVQPVTGWNTIQSK